MSLKYGFILGGFSQNPISKNTSEKGKGFLMSVSNKKIYHVKPKYEGKVVQYDENLFVFGNSELVVKKNL